MSAPFLIKNLAISSRFFESNKQRKGIQSPFNDKIFIKKCLSYQKNLPPAITEFVQYNAVLTCFFSCGEKMLKLAGMYWE